MKLKLIKILLEKNKNNNKNKNWLVQGIWTSTGFEGGTPYPLYQELSLSPSIQIKCSSLSVPHHLTDIPSSTTCAVQPLTQIADLRRGRGVFSGVPRVHQRVRWQLRQLVSDHADHAVDANVPVRRGQRGRAASCHVRRHGEGVRANIGALLPGVPHPGVRERVADHRREGEVVEAADGAAEVLHGDVLGGQNQVDSVLVVHRERGGADRAGNHLLDREARELRAVWVPLIRVLAGDQHRSRHVGAGLVSVQRHRAPPLRDGGGGGSSVRRRDRQEKIFNQKLLRLRPLAVPDYIYIDRRWQHRTHMIPETHQVRRTLKLLGRSESPRRKLWVIHLRLEIISFHGRTGVRKRKAWTY